MSPKYHRPSEIELAPGIIWIPVPARTLPPAQSVNVYLVGRRGPAVIDPAKFSGSGRGPLLQHLLDHSETKVRTILLTHAHGDHCGAAAEIASIFKAPIAGHSLELDRFVRAFGSDFKLIPLAEGDILEAAPLTIEALHTPGHTRGHLCYYIKSLGVLFSGDTVLGFGTSLVKPPDGDMTEYMRSLEKLKSLPLKLILPGHGPAICEPGEKIQEYIEHRIMRERKIIEAVKLGFDTPSKIAQAVYGEADMKVHGSDLMPRAELMVLAHLLKLEKEGVLVRMGSCGNNSFRVRA